MIEKICSDYFEIGDFSYLVVVDRFSCWPCIYHCRKSEMNSAHLIKIFRELFIAYGAAKELSTDGRPQFQSATFNDFLLLWGVQHKISSAAYPQSNGRAELAVKAAKRIIHNNISINGSLNNDKAARAILQYRNTPIPEIGLSSAQILFHRKLWDSIPSNPQHYQVHRNWIISAEQHEKKFAVCDQALRKQYNTNVKTLLPLWVQECKKKAKWLKSSRLYHTDNTKSECTTPGEFLCRIDDS